MAESLEVMGRNSEKELFDMAFYGLLSVIGRFLFFFDSLPQISCGLRPLKIAVIIRCGLFSMMVRRAFFFDGHSLLQGEAFAPLSDARVFADCKLDYETLTWLDGELDVAPEFVYENSLDCNQ